MPKSKKNIKQEKISKPLCIEETLFRWQYIDVMNELLDRHHKNTSNDGRIISKTYYHNNAQKEFDNLFIKSHLITDLNSYEAQQDVPIEKYISSDLNLETSWRITKVQQSKRESGGVFRLCKGDKKEYDMVMLFGLKTGDDTIFNDYINKYEQIPFDIEDTQRINDLNKIKRMIDDFYQVCLEWTVSKELVDEDDDQIKYVKTLTHMRYYSTNVAILPAGTVKCIKTKSKSVQETTQETNIVIILTKYRLEPIPIKCNFVLKGKSGLDIIFKKLAYEIKDSDCSLTLEGKNGAKDIDCDICYFSYIGSGKDIYMPITDVGCNKINNRILLADTEGNIWENTKLLDCFKEKIINICDLVADGYLGLQFNIMYDKLNPFNMTDYFEFWYFTFEENLFIVLMIIAYGAFGLSNDISIDELLSHRDYQSGTRIEYNDFDSFTNAIMFIFGLAGSGKTTIITLILTIMYGLPKNKIVFNQDYTKASVLEECYKLGSLTVLHDDILQKIFRSGDSLATFIMTIASRLTSKIASKKEYRGVRSASIISGEKNLFGCPELRKSTDVHGPYSRVMSYLFKLVKHSEAFWKLINQLLTNLLGCTQGYWSTCTWGNNKIIVNHLTIILIDHFGEYIFEKYIKSSRSFTKMLMFISFIYNYVLDFMFIKYDIYNLTNCKFMALVEKHVIRFFEDSMIQTIDFNL